jgi:hypothetical protein
VVGASTHPTCCTAANLKHSTVLDYKSDPFDIFSAWATIVTNKHVPLIKAPNSLYTLRCNKVMKLCSKQLWNKLKTAGV